MASNKLIEDALTKQVSESAVNAIVGSLESHLASTTSQPSDSIPASSSPTIAISSQPNLVQLQTVGGPIPQTVRPRGHAPTTIVRAPSGQLIHIPIRQQNAQNVQLVQVPNTTALTGIRGRGVGAPAGMIPGTIQGSINAANVANLTRVMTPGPSGATQTLMIGNQQVRLPQQLLQAGQGVSVTNVGAAQGNHQLVAVKTENGYQLVRLAAGQTLQPGTNAVPVSMASMQQNLGNVGIRFQSLPSPVRPAGQQLIQQQIQQQSPQQVQQPQMQQQQQQQQLQQAMVGSQPIVVRPGAPSPSNLQSRSPAGVAVVQPQQQPASGGGPPPLIQQSRMVAPSGGSVPPRAPTPAQSPSSTHPPPASPASSTASSSSTSSGGQMPPDTARTKCKNFLGTLLRLANEQPETVARNVRRLIQGLVDGQILPEEFTNKLQKELNSSPQPCLVPFLKKSLPYLRMSLAKNEMTIDGVNAPPLSSVTLPQSPSVQTAVSQPSTPRMAAVRPPVNRIPAPSPTLVQQRQMAPPGTVGIRVQVQQQQQPNMPQQGVPGLAHRATLQHAQQQPHDSQGSFTSNQMPQSMSMNPFPGALKIMTPTPLQNSISSPSPSPVGNSGAPVQTSAPTMNVPSSLPPLPPMPPIPSPVASKSKAKSKAAAANPSTTANGVPSPKPSAPKGGKSAANGTTPGKGSKAAAKDKRPAVSTAANASASSGGAGRNEVDDINDVAAMGGVNLVEESQRILGSTEFIGAVARSCPDEMCLDSEGLVTKVAEICVEKGLDASGLAADVLMLISHAGEEMIKAQLAKLSHAAQHRMDVFKFNPMYEQCTDVRGQIRFLENVEKGEKQRHEEVEREMLIRAAKSRAKVEDPERAKLREKAKELQRAEQEEIRQREANLTALQAIGTRKKAKAEAPAGANPTMPAPSMMSFRPRVKRVNMRDLSFIWENDRKRCRSDELYRLYLK